MDTCLYTTKAGSTEPTFIANNKNSENKDGSTCISTFAHFVFTFWIHGGNGSGDKSNRSRALARGLA